MGTSRTPGAPYVSFQTLGVPTARATLAGPHARYLVPAPAGSSASGVAPVTWRPRISSAAMRALALAALIPAQLALGGTALYQQSYSGRIYPHISAMGVEIGGLRPADARAALQSHVDTLSRQRVTLRAGDLEAATTLGTLGVVPQVSPDGLITRAWEIGRVGSPTEWASTQWELLRSGAALPVGLGVDRARGRAALEQLAPAFAAPATDAALFVAATPDGAQVVVTPAQPGHTLDIEATLDRLQLALWQGVPASFEVALAPLAPQVSDGDVAQAAGQAARVLSGPLTFVQDAQRHWDVAPADVAGALRVVPAADGQPARLEVDPASARALVDRIAAIADRPAQNPQLAVEGDRVVVRPGADGSLLDREAATREALAQLAAGERTVTLTFHEDKPWLREADLGAARDWANTHLALPLELEYQGQRRALERRDLAAALALPETRDLSRPAQGQQGAVPAVGKLDAEKLRGALQRAVPGLIGLDPAQGPADALLELRDHQLEIRPARSGAGPSYDDLAWEVAQRFGFADVAERVVTVLVVERSPRVTEGQLVAARDLGNRLISEPVLVRDAFDEWKIAPAELEAMLKVLQPGDTNGEASVYLGRDKLLERVDAIARQAEARTGATAVRDASGQPARVDREATGAEVWAAAQSTERTVQLQWPEGSR